MPRHTPASTKINQDILSQINKNMSELAHNIRIVCARKEFNDHVLL